MTARERVERTRLVLGVSVIASAIAWGVAIFLALTAIVAFASSFAYAPKLIRDYASVTAIVIGAVTAAILLWRERKIASPGRVALWIEEKLPRLDYALLTAIEPDHSGDTGALESAVAREDISGVTGNTFRRNVLPAGAALLIGAALLYASPATAFGRSTIFSGIVGKGGARTISAASRLNDLRVEINPPEYSGQARRTLDDPGSISALVGSRITIGGDGAPDGIIARIGNMTPTVRESGSGWQVQLVMPERAAALTLKDRSFQRLLVLEPRIDEAPKVVLVSPVHDTTLRKPSMTVRFHAQATDDIALSTGYFEYLITSGSGEIFTGRTINTPLTNFGGARTAPLDATLDLSSLKLGQGDVVSIRAIVRDANTLSGPSIGTSDTRTIRIARADEYDSLAVDAGAPAPIDSSTMSQRMLIAMTEKLVREQPKLEHKELVKRSTEIGDMEDGIRKKVHEILFEGEDLFGKEKPGEPPPSIEEMEPPDEITGLRNPDLTAAYNALWEAVRSLQIAEPAPALPPMRVALKALDRARIANRLYLRGIPPKIIVDLQRVRLTGKEKGSPSVRTPRSFADSARVRLSARFNAVLDLIPKQPARALTELALIQVDALSTLPDVAAALAQATDAIRAGRDATVPLMRVRRALDGPPQATPGLPLWSGG
jgi:hypothetical protein